MNVMSREHSPFASRRESSTNSTERRAFLSARIFVTKLSHLIHPKANFMIQNNIERRIVVQMSRRRQRLDTHMSSADLSTDVVAPNFGICTCDSGIIVIITEIHYKSVETFDHTSVVVTTYSRSGKLTKLFSKSKQQASEASNNSTKSNRISMACLCDTLFLKQSMIRFQCLDENRRNDINADILADLLRGCRRQVRSSLCTSPDFRFILVACIYLLNSKPDPSTFYND